jgi:hypothetical protein
VYTSSFHIPRCIVVIPLCRPLGGTLDSISRSSTRRSGLGCGRRWGARRRFGRGVPCAVTENKLLAKARSILLPRGLLVAHKQVTQV